VSSKTAVVAGQPGLSKKFNPVINQSTSDDETPLAWPNRPERFGDPLSPVEAAQYLRLDELGTHTPRSAIRTLKFWRDRGELRATKYARHVWYRKEELDRFLAKKTEPPI